MAGEAIKINGPPAQPPLSWRVTAGDVGYEVAAEGYQTIKEITEIYEDVQLPVKLVERVEGLESVVSATPALQDFTGQSATLTLTSHDRHVRFDLFENGGKLVASGRHSGEYVLPTGVRVQWSLSGFGVVSSSTVELRPEGHVEMYAPKATLPAAVEKALTNAHMAPAGGVAYPSEVFDQTTVRHLGSLLSWAASAARYRAAGARSSAA